MVAALATPAPARAESERPRSLAAQTAHLVLSADDETRSANLSLVLAGFAVVGVVDEIVIYGPPRDALGRLCMILLGLVAVGGVVARALRRAADEVRVVTAIVLGTILVAAGACCSLHVGVFSGFQAIVVLALSVFGLDGRRRLVMPLVVTGGLLCFVPAMLIALGVIDDPGHIVAGNVPRLGRITMAATMVIVYSAVVLQSHRARRAMQSTVERSNEVMLQARQDELRLAEANQNLDMVLHADGGRGGRYTGLQVGSFRLGAIVGRGSMGEVYAAERAADGRKGAVKLLTAQALGDEAILKRFLREAQIASTLRAPNVVEMLEIGAAPDGAPFIAMELLVGHDLAWHLRQRRRLTLSEVVRLAHDVALGLDAAHAAGIVHRDLKPPNLFLHAPSPARREVWKVLDFGVGKVRDSGGTLTEGVIVGTPGYWAPEQVEGRETDHRADVFALGAVAYRALTGQPPFGVEHVQAMFEVVYRQPVAPSALARAIPLDVDLVMAIALAKDRADRFESASAFAAALEAATQGELSEPLRTRAAELLRTRPWGSIART